MNGAPPPPAGKQRGTLIVALMAGIAILMILSTVAVQSWSDISRRDAEAEMMFRAEDIVRALKRYQADQGKLPTEFKVLIEPGQKGQYFLRRLWKDPLVKGGAWQFVYANPGGGIYDPTVSQTPEGGAPPQPGQSPSLLNPTEPGTVPGIGKAGDGSAEPTGLPIAGVKTRCTDRPFRRYKNKTDYKDWVFSIFDQDPRLPTMQAPDPSKSGALGSGSFPPTKR